MINIRGFSLIELLVVMALIAVLMAAVTPNFVKHTAGSDDRVDFFNALVSRTYEEARRSSQPAYFTIYLGSSDVSYHNETGEEIRESYSHGTFQSVYINLENPPSLERKIFVYPDGLVDYFKIGVSDDTEIESVPLLRAVKLKKV